MNRSILQVASYLASAAALAALMSASASAAVIVSEVAPYASGNTVYAADWFELTNTGSSAVDISGWKMDDNSNSAAAAVALRGVGTIAPGQSVVFIEGLADGSTDNALKSAFATAWFGAAAPATLVLGNYGGSGVGLSSSADAVNIFDAVGTLVTRIDFGASTAGRSFDNAAGVNNAVVSALSNVGVNGAFVAFNGAEVGSPGAISAVPETGSAALWLPGLLGLWLMRRKSV